MCHSAPSCRCVCRPCPVSLVHYMSNILERRMQILLRRGHAFVSEIIHYQFQVPGSVEELGRKAVPCGVEHQFLGQLGSFSDDSIRPHNPSMSNVASPRPYSSGWKYPLAFCPLERALSASRTRSLRGTNRVDSSETSVLPTSQAPPVFR